MEDFRNENLEEIDFVELQSINGGSWLSDAICWVAGAMFMTPGKMAVDGYAAQTHSY